MNILHNVSQHLRQWAELAEALASQWHALAPAKGDRTPLRLAAFDLDSPLLMFGSGDAIRSAELCEGVAILGATGSGKSSSIGALLAQQLLAARLWDGKRVGFLVLCAKPDECKTWQQYAERTGRKDDLIVMEARGDEAFNFLEWEAAKAKRQGVKLTENIVSMFMEVLSVTQGQKQHSDSFWIDATRELMRNAIDLLQAGGNKVTLHSLCEIIDTAPLTHEEAASEEWQESSFCYQSITGAAEAFAAMKLTVKNLPAKERDRFHSEERDFKTAHDYFMVKFPAMDERPRSGVLMMWSSLIDMFRRGVMADLFCGKTTFDLEDIEQGKVLILNLPALGVMKESGRIAQILMKYLFQRHIQARDVSLSPCPAVIWADEAHYFTSQNDVLFMTTARSSRTITVYISQTMRNFQEVLGNKSEISADALLAGFQTKIFCCNGDDYTNQWGSRLIGSTWQFKTSTTTGRTTQTLNPGESNNDGSSTQEQLCAQIDAVKFTLLRKGGAANNFYVDCVIFQPGKRWGNGKNHLEITLNQKQINGEERR